MDKVTITEKQNDKNVYNLVFTPDVVRASLSQDGTTLFSFTKDSDKVFSNPPVGEYAIAVWYMDEENKLQVTGQTWVRE